MSEYAKMLQGIGLQMGWRPSKGDNETMLMRMRAKTDSDYIRQAKESQNHGRAVSLALVIKITIA